MTGPRLLAVASLGIAAMCALLVIVYGHEPAAAHAIVRWTARTSLAFFALAYVARPLVQLRPTRTAREILARRKWLGLCFASSHLAHLIGIVAIAWPDPGAFVRALDPTILIAVVTYLLLFAMAVTSIEKVKRKMSRSGWKRLHRAGIHFAWLSFAGTYATAIGASAFYVIPTALLLGIAGVRAAAWLRARRIATAHSNHNQAHSA